MMSLRVISFLLLAVNLVSAFAPQSVTRPMSAVQLQAFEPKPLEEGDAKPLESASADAAEGEEEAPKIKAVYKNMARGGQMEEVQWVDDAMMANTSFELDWWAIPLVVIPFMLLADDIFHFLPSDGPLALFKKL